VDKLTLRSYAKLNLYLEILNKRTDKFHNLKTLFERIDLCDTITLTSRRDNEINIISSCRELPKVYSQNLAYRAAILLQDVCRINKGVDIRITKRIPIGAGLGGGSSNAAYVLLGLNKLWGLGLSRAKLLTLARRLGSDVPFFIYNSAFALGEAKGDVIRELKSLKGLRFWHILVVPGVHVSTPYIYKGWDKLVKEAKLSKKAALTPLDRLRLAKNKNYLTGLTRPGYDVKMLILALKKKDLSLVAHTMHNSLQEVTPRFYPAVSRILEALRKLGLKATLMSGSGPAVFAIVSSGKEAATLVRRLKGKHGFARVEVTRTLT
jgi:4-diphosphocytidyl-2-C-methyl-D-erythritol kinase